MEATTPLNPPSNKQQLNTTPTPIPPPSQPRNLESLMEIKSTSLVSELASHPGSVKVFLLLPSSTSSPSAMLLAEFTCCSLSVVKELLGPVLGDDALHIIRLDDYLMHGDRAVSALAESGKRVYPKEEATSMLVFFEKVLDLAEPLTEDDVEEGQEALIGTLRPQSRFDAR